MFKNNEWKSFGRKAIKRLDRGKFLVIDENNIEYFCSSEVIGDTCVLTGPDITVTISSSFITFNVCGRKEMQVLRTYDFIGFIVLMQLDMQYGQHTGEIIKTKINLNRVGNAKRVWGSVAAMLSLGVVSLADAAQIEPYKMVLASHCLIVLAFMMDTFMFREYKDQVINKE